MAQLGVKYCKAFIFKAVILLLLLSLS